ncbi:hypothetical protein [Stackebrandtia soli]|uniref:hypothetical protein n=1 Tax=Stackebrandtia soli TaxID=1892856 RepID=UPI0039ED348B
MTTRRDDPDRVNVLTVDGNPMIIEVSFSDGVYAVCRSATSADTIRVYAPANGHPRRVLVCTITGTGAGVPEAAWNAAYQRPDGTDWRDALVVAAVSAARRADTRTPPGRPPVVWEFRPSGA